MGGPRQAKSLVNRELSNLGNYVTEVTSFKEENPYSLSEIKKGGADMKNLILFLILILGIFSFLGNALGHEGGTKAIATMIHLETGETQFGPIFVIPHEEMAPTKSIVEFLRSVPKPTLSMERVREEQPGKSLGTKLVVFFQNQK